ncbi:molybdenum cofactor guanylyltransferase [Rubrivirga marina]|uniref:MobA-like NTP transferase domain-containing protein n=1 Tax=Rubrivirga marina TaxID=1196024 RepID=A0A271IX03_9BACT|nr:molybdenum cofactor guanylyltransferase [Rubrivirga marina]PAP75468.1 hypothetical protein BSZ37_02910 [Rubrivirga marina]
MPEPSEVTGLILAGGASRRFGRDKALVELGGLPFVAIVHAALAPHVGTMLLATGSAPRDYPVPAEVVLDAAPDAGPLAGLVAGLEAAETPWVLSAAVDLPYLTPAALRPLVTAEAGRADALVAVDARGRRQPTLALWRVATAAPVARACLTERRLALRDVLARLAVREVAVEGGALHNVNAPGDLG